MPTEIRSHKLPDGYYDPDCRSIRDVLEVVANAPAGLFSWVDTSPCPLGHWAEIAKDEGYVSHQIIGWDAKETLTLTWKGREYLGLPSTLGDKARAWIVRLVVGH